MGQVVGWLWTGIAAALLIAVQASAGQDAGCCGDASVVREPGARVVRFAAAPAQDPVEAAARPERRRPAVLIDNWGATVDERYMRRLADLGFTVDAIPHEQLTWERLKQFNVLVITDLPPQGEVKKGPEGGPASGPDRDATFELINQFLQAGGGVMINLVQHDNMPAFHDATNWTLQHWGARRPMEKFQLEPAATTAHPRLHIPMFYSDQVSASSVSDGVRGVWWPTGQSTMLNHSGPIDVDERWTVVLRGPTGSATSPIALPPPKPGVPYYQSVHVRPAPVERPVMFAIRDLQPGRLALFHLNPIFHFRSGMSWFHDEVVLSRGLSDRPSDFGKLLENTLHWLAGPSVGGDALGGAVVPEDRWTPPLQKEAHRRQFFTAWNHHAKDLRVDPSLPSPRLHRGMIGARTARSGGQGTVADYAGAARAAGLGFIIFLEDFSQLSADELAALTRDCQAASSDDLLLVPGYRIRTNVGNTLFIFGMEPILIHDQYLSSDRQMLMLQPRDAQGRLAPSRFIDFVFQSLKGEKNSIGYFDFTGSTQGPEMAMRVEDLRLYSMVGVHRFAGGILVEDATEQYLAMNQGTMSGTPVSINLVNSPQELQAEAAAGRGLTYAAAHSPRQLWPQALRWNGTYDGMHVFPSTGPIIHQWPTTVRAANYAGEKFVVNSSLLPQTLHVSADAGLAEVRLYDGARLVRRFLPGGRKEFRTRLFLNAVLQQNLSVVVTDTAGGTAVSVPLRTWQEGSPAAVFCADHVNDCVAMRLFRGPGWQRHANVPTVVNPGVTWDGGPPASMPLLPLGHFNPTIASSLGQQSGSYCQIPLLQVCDEYVHQGSSRVERVMAPGVPHLNAWSGFGPMQPAPLASFVATYTEWAQYSTGIPTGFGAGGNGQGPTPTLYAHTATFLADQTITQYDLSRYWRQPLPVSVTLVIGRGDQAVRSLAASPRVDRVEVAHRLEAGDWFAAISLDMGNASLHINRGEALQLVVREDRVELRVDLPKDGLLVRAGQRHTVELWSCAWPLDEGMGDLHALMRRVGYLRQPDGLELPRGRRVEGPGGLLELQPDDGAVELALPRPTDGLDANVPVRVRGFNPRWSALLLLVEGHTNGNAYGGPVNRIRPLGVNESGDAFFPVHAVAAARTHLHAGHPLVADDAGRELFIQVTCLKDAQSNQPPRWHVSVHNPTDHAIRTRLRLAMSLPGLNLPPEPEVIVEAGQSLLLVHQP